MLEFGHFYLFLFLTCRFFLFFFLVLPFVSSLIIASNTLPNWTGWDGRESDKTDMGNLPTLLPGTFFKVGRRAGQLDSGIKTSFLLWSHNSSQKRRHAESVCSRVNWDES